MTQKRHTRKNKSSLQNQYLYPPIKPLNIYKLQVSEIYTIPVWTFGNPKGKPVIFIHGGPGGGTTFNDARFFNPKKYFIVLVDQRGCGKSTPLANGIKIEDNTPKDLISDFEKVRNYLNIEKWMVFGGSWGSTLSLAYTMAHPNKVTELIIRGVFFCSRGEIDWLIEPKGAQQFHPEAWNYYESSLPERDKFKGDYLEGFKRCFSGIYGNKKKEHCMLAWAAWEDANSLLHTKPLKQIIRESKKTRSYISNASIENYYFSNQCFFKNNYFLKKTNLDKIRHIPTTIVQGLYDLECPFMTAYKLHKALPHAGFFPTMAGHSAYDPENTKYLVKATNSFT